MLLSCNSAQLRVVKYCCSAQLIFPGITFELHIDVKRDFSFKCAATRPESGCVIAPCFLSINAANISVKVFENG